jgi:hypothetical protein
MFTNNREEMYKGLLEERNRDEVVKDSPRNRVRQAAVISLLP